MVDVFNSIKHAVREARTLGLYDPTKDLTLTVDASQKGLGPCLLQDDAPILFFSKSLTQTEQNLSNIERECLVVVFGQEHLKQFVYR